MPIYRLQNVIQPYAWGSTTAIADLLGQPLPSAKPQAEMWMGTHPKGPSKVLVDGDAISLQTLIDQQPEAILGEAVYRQFGGNFPFLFKVLAVASPLSIQAHPNAEQAREGFARENQQGIAMDAPERNYRDENHKPEIICALTPFWALNGFRHPRLAAELLAPVWPSPAAVELTGLKQDRQGHGLRAFFEAVMSLGDEKQAMARILRDKAAALMNTSPVYRWMVKLADAYPGDMGILAPALLNLICLSPGQALYLPAGQLHAYLQGTGIELMANSDNVLRGGLTPKHVALDELLRIVRFEATRVDILAANLVGPAESRFLCPAAEFALGVLEPTPEHPYHAPARRSVEILLCTAGKGVIQLADTGESEICKGDSFLIPANAGSYTIDGDLTFTGRLLADQ